MEKSTLSNHHLQLEEGEELVIINYRLVKRKIENDFDGSKDRRVMS